MAAAKNPERQAEAVRIPEPTRALRRQRLEQAEYRAGREAQAMRAMVRGVVVLALAILLASFWRAGWTRVFLPGWWRHW